MNNLQDYDMMMEYAEFSMEDLLTCTAGYIAGGTQANVGIFLCNRYMNDWTLASLFTRHPEALTQHQFEMSELGAQIGHSVVEKGGLVCGTTEELSETLDTDIHWMGGNTMLFATAKAKVPLAMIAVFAEGIGDYCPVTRQTVADIATKLGERIQQVTKIRTAGTKINPDEDGEMESGVPG